MPKLVFVRTATTHLFVGLGPSLSVKRLGAGDAGGAFRRYGTGLWLNADCGFEVQGPLGRHVRNRGGWHRRTVGQSHAVASDVVGPEYWVGIRGLVTPQMRAGVGYAF